MSQENLKTGGSIQYGAFVLAAWCYYSDRRVDAQGEPIEIIDNREAELHQSAKDYAQDGLSFLRISDIFGSLVENQRFVAEYSRILADIYQDRDVRRLMSLLGARRVEQKNPSG